MNDVKANEANARIELSPKGHVLLFDKPQNSTRYVFTIHEKGAPEKQYWSHELRAYREPGPTEICPLEECIKADSSEFTFRPGTTYEATIKPLNGGTPFTDIPFEHIEPAAAAATETPTGAAAAPQSTETGATPDTKTATTVSEPAASTEADKPKDGSGLRTVPVYPSLPMVEVYGSKLVIRPSVGTTSFIRVFGERSNGTGLGVKDFMLKDRLKGDADRQFMTIWAREVNEKGKIDATIGENLSFRVVAFGPDGKTFAPGARVVQVSVADEKVRQELDPSLAPKNGGTNANGTGGDKPSPTGQLDVPGLRMFDDMPVLSIALTPGMKFISVGAKDNNGREVIKERPINIERIANDPNVSRRFFRRHLGWWYVGSQNPIAADSDITFAVYAIYKDGARSEIATLTIHVDADLLAEITDRREQELQDAKTKRETAPNPKQPTDEEHTLREQYVALRNEVERLTREGKATSEEVGRLKTKMGEIENKLGSLDRKVDGVEKKVDKGFTDVLEKLGSSKAKDPDSGKKADPDSGKKPVPPQPAVQHESVQWTIVVVLSIVFALAAASFWYVVRQSPPANPNPPLSQVTPAVPDAQAIRDLVRNEVNAAKGRNGRYVDLEQGGNGGQPSNTDKAKAEPVQVHITNEIHLEKNIEKKERPRELDGNTPALPDKPTSAIAPASTSPAPDMIGEPAYMNAYVADYPVIVERMPLGQSLSISVGRSIGNGYAYGPSTYGPPPRQAIVQRRNGTWGYADSPRFDVPRDLAPSSGNQHTHAFRPRPGKG
jgi:hypothetical protein